MLYKSNIQSIDFEYTPGCGFAVFYEDCSVYWYFLKRGGLNLLIENFSPDFTNSIKPLWELELLCDKDDLIFNLDTNTIVNKIIDKILIHQNPEIIYKNKFIFNTNNDYITSLVKIKTTVPDLEYIEGCNFCISRGLPRIIKKINNQYKEIILDNLNIIDDNAIILSKNDYGWNLDLSIIGENIDRIINNEIPIWIDVPSYNDFHNNTIS